MNGIHPLLFRSHLHFSSIENENKYSSRHLWVGPPNHQQQQTRFGHTPFILSMEKTGVVVASHRIGDSNA